MSTILRLSFLTLLFAILSTSLPAQWTQLNGDIDGAAAFDQSGFSVSLSADGSRVAIGARLNDAMGGNNNGHTRVYQFNSTTMMWE
ncbi:MAG: hypothetical protein R3350_08370, partial [Saprospiraceae bacterium]|nr:hypothetical protein [Saprospiraceae bacterium]